MDKEILDTLDDLSKRPTTELAMRLMETTVDNMAKDKELDKYKNIVDKAITFINVFQDEKSLTLNYNDLKHLRSILKGDEFGLRILEDKLKELKGE